MHCLEHLDLAHFHRHRSCGNLGYRIQTLKKLNLKTLISVSDRTIVVVADNCLNLEVLDLTGCELVTGTGIRAFSSHIRLKCLVLCSCFGFGQSDVTHIVLGCRSLKSIVVDKRIRMWFLQMQERISRVVWYR